MMQQSTYKLALGHGPSTAHHYEAAYKPAAFTIRQPSNACIWPGLAHRYVTAEVVDDEARQQAMGEALAEANERLLEKELARQR